MAPVETGRGFSPALVTARAIDAIRAANENPRPWERETCPSCGRSLTCRDRDRATIYRLHAVTCRRLRDDAIDDLVDAMTASVERA